MATIPQNEANPEGNGGEVPKAGDVSVETLEDNQPMDDKPSEALEEAQAHAAEERKEGGYQ